MEAPREFTKIFNHPIIGQILVKRDANDDGNPCVSFTVDTSSYDLGLCAASQSWTDTNEGWDQMDKFFESVDEVKAFSVAENLLAEISKF